MKLNGSPTERTTAATDVLLSAAAAAGIVLLQSFTPAASLRVRLWSWAFALIAGAAALGAVYHGLALAERPRARLWRILTACLSMAISLVAVGVVHDGCGEPAAGRLLPVLLGVGVLIYFASRMCAGLFAVFVGYQATVLAVSLGVYVWLAATGALAGAGWMAAGAAASLVAAAIQAARGLHVKMIWEFDSNGVFHLVQTVGVIFFWVGLSFG